jgi:two-component system OmpR family response regulator
MFSDMRVLVVEDEAKMAALIQRGLSEQGLTVDVAGSGEDATGMALGSSYDAIVLDLMLPGIDGFETCRQMRTEGILSPVLILTARGGLEDRLAGLEGGADDYLTKPFAFAELLARLRALIRRGHPERPAVLIDPGSREVWRGEAQIDLSAEEFDLLEVLMRNPGLVLSPMQLINRAWGHESEHRSNLVEFHVRDLRRKIDEPFGVTSIEMIRGAGYRLRKDGGR